MVTGFVLDDVTTAPWKVILEDAPISGATFSGTTEVDFGGGPTTTNAGGTWQGSFYNDTDDGATDAMMHRARLPARSMP